MNNWKIPKEMENKIRERDFECVYCGIKFTNKVISTWEHIINDETIISYDNIALCCRPCNSSKSSRKLSEWISRPYCKNKNINIETVADVIKQALKRGW